MANMIDYLDWRGDLSFAIDPFNTIDALILAQLVYIPFENIVSDPFGQTLSIREAFDRFQVDNVDFRLHPMSFADDIILFEKVAESARFRDILLTGYVNQIDNEKDLQFSAITYILEDDLHYIAYRGTDGTIAGWKEDFNAIYMPVVPAQICAVDYLNAHCSYYHTRMLLGGHSKGGNLAVYAAVYCEDRWKEMIENIYDFDGPGFRDEIVESEEYEAMTSRITSIIPESSLVGQLLTNNVEHKYVKSSANGIKQHFTNSWQVRRNDFVYVEQLSRKGTINNIAMRNWLDSLDDEERKIFVDSVFDVIRSTECETMGELSSNKLKTTSEILRALSRLSPEQNKTVKFAMKQLAMNRREALREH